MGCVILLLIHVGVVKVLWLGRCICTWVMPLATLSWVMSLYILGLLTISSVWSFGSGIWYCNLRIFQTNVGNMIIATARRTGLSFSRTYSPGVGTSPVTTPEARSRFPAEFHLAVSEACPVDFFICSFWRIDDYIVIYLFAWQTLWLSLLPPHLAGFSLCCQVLLVFWGARFLCAPKAKNKFWALRGGVETLLVASCYGRGR